MKLETLKLNECIGKTIQKAVDDNHAALVRFTDGTLLAISAQDGCNCDESDPYFLYLKDIDLDDSSWRHLAMWVGVISQEEALRITYEKEQRQKAERAAARRQQYEALKAEFEKQAPREPGV